MKRFIIVSMLVFLFVGCEKYDNMNNISIPVQQETVEATKPIEQSETPTTNKNDNIPIVNRYRTNDAEVEILSVTNIPPIKERVHLYILVHRRNTPISVAPINTRLN